ncbi:MAG: hypothetical protein J5715_10755 [Clostridiales bacterium]|nr:hypothetical protein [Clostridiales bacterium]MBO4580623.1 hypothetical protein [Clostridiales bacterium]
MKITQSRDYKKPLYAIGLTTALVATAVTGCGPIGYAGDIQVPTSETTEEVQLAGEVDVGPDETECTTEESLVELDGEVAVAPSDS